VQSLSYSRMRLGRECWRRHYYSYELGIEAIRDAAPLRMGSAVHLGCECWNKGAEPAEAKEVALTSYREVPAGMDAYRWRCEGEIVGAMLDGYFWRYEGERLEYLAVETSFELPLINPKTNAKSRTFHLRGRIDGIVRMGAQMLVLERKTASGDISPASDYWLRLRMDQQVSLYVYAARRVGWPCTGALYDVLRKPGSKPARIPTRDSDGLKVVVDDQTGARVMIGADQKPRQTAGKGMTLSPDLDEAGLKVVTDDATGERVMIGAGPKPRQSAGDGMTMLTVAEEPEAYGARLLADIGDRPDWYFARREVARLDQDLEEFAVEAWEHAQVLRWRQRLGMWGRNVGMFTCNRCEFKNLCLNGLEVDPENPPSGFRKRLHVKGEENGEGTTNTKSQDDGAGDTDTRPTLAGRDV